MPVPIPDYSLKGDVLQPFSAQPRSRRMRCQALSPHAYLLSPSWLPYLQLHAECLLDLSSTNTISFIMVTTQIPMLHMTLRRRSLSKLLRFRPAMGCAAFNRFMRLGVKGTFPNDLVRLSGALKAYKFMLHDQFRVLPSRRGSWSLQPQRRPRVELLSF
jgi:hypothetical protein